MVLDHHGRDVLGGTDPVDKTKDDKRFKQRWITFGMVLKVRADGYGIDWRKMTMEEWFKKMLDAEGWHHKEEECAM